MEDPALLALAHGPAALVAAFLFGTLWGSFANVCIYRWPPTDEHPDGRSVVTPGSHCGACGKPVRWYDNVPILSWLWLRGRCRDCGTTFSARYLLVEALTGALFAAAWWFAIDGRILVAPLGDGLVRFGIGAAFAFVMVVILFIDLDHKLILDKVTFPAVPIFYGLSLLLPERAWWEGLVGAAVGYGIVRAIADGYWLITRREGMGYGDGKLLAVVGALLGWKGVMVSLFGGSMLGVVVAIPAIVVARARARGERDDGEGADDGASGLRPPTSGPEDAGSEAREVIEGDSEASDDDADGEDQDPRLGQVELPFGPFLALAALFWWFAEPYVMFSLRHP
jgi:leader peptidase (prepilin peptidase)/N-methyltransferase